MQETGILGASKIIAMKTKEYVEKYQLHKNDTFDHKEFTSDLTNEFFSLLEIGKNSEGQINIKGYENAVGCIRRKWDAVNNKTVGQLPEKLWNYFYATVIAKVREEMFPKEMKLREEKKRAYEERKNFRKTYDDMWESMYARFLFGAILNGSSNKKQLAFERLGLPVTATVDEVKSSYRALSLKHHPDRGGKQEEFIALTEAKNKCLAYFQI
jgi:hypothetical protein